MSQLHVECRKVSSLHKQYRDIFQVRGHGGTALLRAEGRHGAAGGGLGEPRGGKHDAVHGGGYRYTAIDM